MASVKLDIKTYHMMNKKLQARGAPKLVFVEFNFEGSIHQLINSSMAISLVKAFPDHELHLIGDKTHIDSISQPIKGSLNLLYINVSKETKKIYRNTINYYFAPIKRLNLFVKSFQSIQTSNDDFFFFASNNEFDFFCIWFLVKFKKIQKCAIVLHGNLNEVHAWQSKNPFRLMLNYKSAITRISSLAVKLICLEANVEKNIKKIIPEISANLIVIPHPIDQKHVDYAELSLTRPLTFSFIGKLSSEKGPEQFEDLACKLSSEIYNFWFIGWTDEYVLKNEKHFSLLPKQQFLEQCYIEEKIQDSDFICIFNQDDYYKLSASGVLLDAIKYNKPLIHLGFQLIRDIEEDYGQISIEADSIEELVEKIRRTSFNEIIEMKDRLRKVADARSCENQIQLFKNLFA